MIAILSDIHGNLEALQAVLRDARESGANSVYCLGDVVGYGASPRECLDIATDFAMTLLGNHDQAALFDPAGFSGPAERAIFWTRSVLEAYPEDRVQRERRWEFLADRPQVHREDNALFVHGSPRNPLNEYVFPEDAFNHRQMESLFGLVQQVCFQGHTHIPGVFTQTSDAERYRFWSPDELGDVYRLTPHKILCNVGSVGQPRDRDPRASYVLFDGQTIQFRRIDYDIEEAIRKIQQIPQLDSFLGNRLRRGQ